jgi:hypothetical protein
VQAFKNIFKSDRNKSRDSGPHQKKKASKPNKPFQSNVFTEARAPAKKSPRVSPQVKTGPQNNAQTAKIFQKK